MKYIDTHTHINFAAFDEDRDEVIKRTLEGDTAMLIVGTQKDTSKKAVELAEEIEAACHERSRVGAIIGLHPVHTEKTYHDEKELGPGGDGGFTSRGEVFDTEYYKNLAKSDKVVGIGECGLDYFRLNLETKDVQKEAFIAQIHLGNELNKPLMLHIREGKGEDAKAYKDALEILKKESKVIGTAHFFAGTPEDAQGFLDLGFYISFSGVITFAKEYEEVVKYVPMDRILSETDAPYVAPVPHRGKRNEPLFVQEVAKKICEIKGIPLDEGLLQLRENAKRLFGV